MIEEIEIQTVDDVKRIDYMKATNETLNATIDEQTAHLENISSSLDDINSAINTPTDLTEALNAIDTTVMENQTHNILQTVNTQQEQIDGIQSDVQEIKELLTQLINK